MYYKNHTSGEVNSKINDIDNIKSFVSKLFMSLFVDLLLLIISFVILFSINQTLSIVILLIFILYTFSLFSFKNVFSNKIDTVRLNKANVNSKMIEYINNFESIRSLKIEENVKESFNSDYSNYLNNIFDLEKTYTYQKCIKKLNR